MNFKRDNLEVCVCKSRSEMGKVAAEEIAQCFKKLLKEKNEINVVFAAAPSQNEVLAELVKNTTIEWERINAFHMDEYVGLRQGAEQSFALFLKKHIFDLVPFATVNLMRCDAAPEEEALRYQEIIKKNIPDVVILGIGENGHIAFNDPDVADFFDKKLVKVVRLDKTCRMQQVHDGCFESLDAVPEQAITLTVPALLSAGHMFCIVPGLTKAQAVYNTVINKISESCPASILRVHRAAKLYLDEDSSLLLVKND